MAAERCPTGRVLSRVWKRWATEHERQFGSKPSLRLVSSCYLEGKPDLLARWTTAATRPHWRVPLARLKELQVTFNMTTSEVDDLVLARIEELETDVETLALVGWLLDFLDRAALSEEERLVLETWRAVRADRPHGLQPGEQGRQDLEKMLRKLLMTHERLQEAERLKTPVEDVTAEEKAALVARAQTTGVKLAALSRHKRPKTLSPRKETKELLTRIRAMASLTRG